MGERVSPGGSPGRSAGWRADEESGRHPDWEGTGTLRVTPEVPVSEGRDGSGRRTVTTDSGGEEML